MTAQTLPAKPGNVYAASHIEIRLHQLVRRRVGEDDRRLERLGLLEVHQGVGHDDDDVVRLHLAGSGAVQADAARAAFALDDVGLEALAVVVVHDGHLLAGNHVGSVQQVFVDGDAAHVVEVGLGDAGAMDFRFQNFNKHLLLF